MLYVPLTTGNAMDLYKCIAWELGLETERSRAAPYRCIRNEVTRLCLENNIRPVLVVDEAQHLLSDVLEDLRLLTNYEMDSQNRLCLLRVGQVELRRRLGMAAHEPLSQRIVVRHHLAGLTREELALYLAHLLRLAGSELPLFELPAREAIFHATGGLPRKVNLLSHHALMASAVAKGKSVTPNTCRRRSPRSPDRCLSVQAPIAAVLETLGSLARSGGLPVCATSPGSATGWASAVRTAIALANDLGKISAAERGS